MWPHVIRSVRVTTSRSTLGRTVLNAACMSAGSTEMLTPSRVSANSKPSRPFASRLAASSPAERARCIRSAPTNPPVLRATAAIASLASTLNGISRVWIERISVRAASSGGPTKISSSKRPGRRNAGSMAWMRLVVAIRISPSTSSRPSMSVSSWLAARTSLWEARRSRLVAITSNSSIITSDGAWARALGEQQPQVGLGLALHTAHQLGGRHPVGGDAELVGQRLADQCLAGAGRAVQQHPLGGAHPEAAVERRAQQRQLHQLAQAADDRVAPADVGQGYHPLGHAHVGPVQLHFGGVGHPRRRRRRQIDAHQHPRPAPIDLRQHPVAGIQRHCVVAQALQQPLMEVEGQVVGRSDAGLLRRRQLPRGRHRHRLARTDRQLRPQHPAQPHERYVVVMRLGHGPGCVVAVAQGDHRARFHTEPVQHRIREARLRGAHRHPGRRPRCPAGDCGRVAQLCGARHRGQCASAAALTALSRVALAIRGRVPGPPWPRRPRG